MWKRIVAVVLLGVLSVSTFTGCRTLSQDEYDSKMEEIEKYNKSVEHIISTYPKVKNLGDELCSDIRVYLSTNSLSDKLYKSFKFSEKLSKEKGESDESFRLRQAETLFESNTVLPKYKEYLEGDKSSSWMFADTYTWRCDYYTRAATPYIRQFIVIKGVSSSATMIAHVFWEDEKIVKIIVSYYK